MQLGVIGLGRMGGNMVKRLRADGHEVIGFDLSLQSGRDVDSLEALVSALAAPRVVWIMVPAGAPTDATVDQLAELLEEGDLGVSGGVWGAERGYALMAGGSLADYERALPIFESLKPEGEDGLVLAGSVGGGHFAKMVHNGIEYGMMQAFGEGFETMMRSDLIENPAAVMTSWRQGSVVQSWLLDLFARAAQDDPDLHNMPPVANESGEAKWMIEAALELGVPTPATASALWARQTSRGAGEDTLRVVSSLRAQFGGHVTK